MRWLLCSLVARSLFKARTLPGIYLQPDSHSERQANKESHQRPRACWCQVSPPVTVSGFPLCWKPSRSLKTQCVAFKVPQKSPPNKFHKRVLFLKEEQNYEEQRLNNCCIVAVNRVRVLCFCTDQIDTRSSETKHRSIITLHSKCFSTILFQFLRTGPRNCCARQEVISKSKQQKEDAETKLCTTVASPRAALHWILKATAITAFIQHAFRPDAFQN